MQCGHIRSHVNYMEYQVLQGDCLKVLPSLRDCSVDSIVTDPPYGLEFMGKEWDAFKPSAAKIRKPSERDRQPGSAHNATTSLVARNQPDSYAAGKPYQDWCESWAAECLRVLKPGGHLLAFGGTRTYHRMTCAIEDAGFEIRDSLHWIYGSGFPKSMDVSKAIDKAAGAERTKVTGIKPGHENFTDRKDHPLNDGWDRPWASDPEAVQRYHQTFAPVTENAARWEGFGTALKPAHEPVVVARKPLTGTVAANVLQWGTGALNIDGCRVAHVSEADRAESENKNQHTGYANTSARMGANGIYGDADVTRPDYDGSAGRFPPNILLGEEAAAEMDRQSGVQKSGTAAGGKGNAASIYGTNLEKHRAEDQGYGDTGGASRFFPCFRYQAKAPKKERPSVDGVQSHPTVKPLELMCWLVRLVTPPGGICLDPFAGTGTTGEAARAEGFRCIMIEREEDYIKLIKARMYREPSLFDDM